MQALADAILPAVKAAVSPVPAETWRVEETDFSGVTSVVVPSVWLRPPSTSRGPYATLYGVKDGLLIIDVWHHSRAQVQTVVDSLAFLDGHAPAHKLGPRYRLESNAPVDESDAYHTTLTYSVMYLDSGVLA